MYEGEFVDNYMCGFGFYTFADGKTYEGYYFNDKKHGYGIYTWVDGRKYQGWWLQGKQDGYGSYVSKEEGEFDDTPKLGVWKEGKKVAWLEDEQLSTMEENLTQAKSNRRLSKEQKERLSYVKPADFDDKSY